MLYTIIETPAVSVINIRDIINQIMLITEETDFHQRIISDYTDNPAEMADRRI